MVGFRPSVGLAYTGQYCATQDQRVGVARLLGSLLPGNIRAAVNAINGTTALLCNSEDEITEQDVEDIPFEGGQCDGDCYIVTFSTEGGSTTTLRTRGPIVDFSSEIIDPGTEGSNWRLFVTSRSIPVTSGNCSALLPLEKRQFGGDRVPANFPATVISVANITNPGQGCGNPPGRYVPNPDPLPLPPIDFTWENNQGITVNATANFTLSPAISIGGNVSFPVNIEVGGLNFNGNLALDGSLEFSPTVNINPPGSPPTIGPDLPGDLPAPPDETASVLAGVAITVQNFGSSVTVINAIGAPNLAVPRVASVNFLIDVEGDQFWSSDFDAKNGDCFVPCPPDVVCVDAAVTPYPGVDLTWNRVYREERIPPT